VIGLPFNSVWVVDFEFHAPTGEKPTPICCVARDLTDGRIVRLWGDEMRWPPYDLNDDCLLVGYFTSAEWSCHEVLGWPMPRRVLDLYAEFRLLTNGREVPAGWGLLGALTYFGLDGMAAVHKDSMRDLAIRGGPFTPFEKRQLLGYCQEDVDATARLLKAMLPHIDLPRALLRGRYTVAVARMENRGIPLDVGTLETLTSRWDRIRYKIVAAVGDAYGVFDGSVFKEELFAAWLFQNSIPWPRLSSGHLALDNDSFTDMAKLYPVLAPLREARNALSQLRLNSLAVGSDGRNRCLLSPFASRTSRNQPSNSRFIFGPSVWLRSLIKPAEGYGLAYIDWDQQEFGIAAALSDDENMLAAYTSGDPYLAFARMASAVPDNATKATHRNERELFKICALAVQYGMHAATLARRIGKSEAAGRELLRLHRQTFPRYWRWVEGATSYGMLHGKLWTAFGWTLHVGAGINPRTLANFPMQANGAEMMRLACCLATEAGLGVCAPVHDALLVEAPLEQLNQAVADTQAAMAEASRVVLGGFELRSEAKVTRYPDRYSDRRGEAMWRAVQKHLHRQGAPGLHQQGGVTCTSKVHQPSLLSHASILHG